MVSYAGVPLDENKTAIPCGLIAKSIFNGKIFNLIFFK
jgi:hypothetical protein